MSTVTLPNGKTVRLGRIRPQVLPPSLKLGNYLDPTITPPASIDYTPAAKAALARMYLNDEYGDCVIAAKFHAIGIWTGNETGTPIQGTDAEVKKAYVSFCGPGDNGCNMAAVNDILKTKGVVVNGVVHKIENYVSVDNTNKIEVQVAIDLFGGLDVGVDLPNAWANSEDVWDVTSTRIVGGHCIYAVGYNATGVVVATWGGLRTITWAAFLSKRWVNECYAILAPDWFSSGKTPAGIDANRLRDDFSKLSSGIVPPLDPDPNPSPIVPPIPPVPQPPTPTPTGPTADQVKRAVLGAIEDGRPYGLLNVVGKVEEAAVAGVEAAFATN